MNAASSKKSRTCQIIRFDGSFVQRVIACALENKKGGVPFPERRHVFAHLLAKRTSVRFVRGFAVGLFADHQTDKAIHQSVAASSAAH